MNSAFVLVQNKLPGLGPPQEREVIMRPLSERQRSFLPATEVDLFDQEPKLYQDYILS